MTIQPYSSPWCLQRFNQWSKRPDTASGGTDVITDLSKYARLSEAQQEIVTDIAAICPHVLYPAVSYANMPTLSTVDSQVFTFGYDNNGNQLAPIGKVGIYRSLNDIPSNPMREGSDFLNEGVQIRIPNNQSYSGTLYFRGIIPPPDLNAGQDPGLFPIQSRDLIPIKAALNFCIESNRDPDLAAILAPKYSERWLKQLLAWRTQFRGGGVLGSYTGLRLALGGVVGGSLSTYPYAI